MSHLICLGLRGRSCTLIALLLPFLGVVSAGPVGAESRATEVAREELPASIEEMHAEAAADYGNTRFVGGLYSLDGSDANELILLNKTAEPLAVELAAIGMSGRRYPLGQFVVGAQRHQTLALAELLAEAGKGLRNGMLEAWFWGDEASLQAWTISRRGGHSLELPLKMTGQPAGEPQLSFWDLGSAGKRGAEPVFYLHNPGYLATRFSARVSGGKALEASLEPGASLRLSGRRLGARGRSGWVEFAQSPGDDALVVQAVIEGPGLMARLPVTHRELAATRYESVRVALGGDAVKASPRVSVLNPLGSDLTVRVSLLAQESGAELGSLEAKVAAGELWSRRLDGLVHESFGGAVPASARLRLDGDGAFLAAGWVERSDGELSEMALFGGIGGHPTGTYPLPSLERFAVEHIFVNLGDEPSEIVAQASWEGGTYAIGPITVAPGASHKLDFDELARAGEPDVLGRTLSPDYSNGYFKWMARAGSKDVIARTEATPRGARDSFGFNCYGCCYEMPIGVVVPQSISVGPGQNPLFQACVNYDTCDGPMGPYSFWPDTINAPSPFSWDAVRISASAGADATVNFEGWADWLKVTCQWVARRIFGYGRAEACQRFHNPDNYSSGQTCVSQTSSCSQCNKCCNDIYNMQICKGKRADIATSERNACLGHCATDMC